MSVQSPTMMRCERCRAVLSSTEAPALIRAGRPCGVCGGVLSLAKPHGRTAAPEESQPSAPPARGTAPPRRGDMLPRRR
jgi:hypothetical protein